MKMKGGEKPRTRVMSVGYTVWAMQYCTNARVAWVLLSLHYEFLSICGWCCAEDRSSTKPKTSPCSHALAEADLATGVLFRLPLRSLF